MRLSLINTIAAGLLLATAAGAQATLTATIQDTEGDASSITGVAAGSTFTVLVQVDTTDPVQSVEFRVVADTAGVFDLTKRTFAPGWGGVLAYPFTPPVGLDPQTTGLIGAPREASDTATGNFTFATIEVTVDPAAQAGTHTLTLSGIIAAGATGQQSAGTAYSVTIGGGSTGGGSGDGSSTNGGTTDGGSNSTTDTGTGDESQQLLTGQLLNIAAPLLLLLVLLAFIWMLIADRRYLLGPALLLLSPSPAILANYLLQQWQGLDPSTQASLLKGLAKVLFHGLGR